MIAVDTNILVYAHRVDSKWHVAARACLQQVCEGAGPWTILWPCVHEFLGVVTHPRIFDPPTPLGLAIDQVEAWLESPSMVLLAEEQGYWQTLKETIITAKVAGALVHDARVAALCAHHGVQQLWSADRDFGRFPGLHIRNPLVEHG